MKKSIEIEHNPYGEYMEMIKENMGVFNGIGAIEPSAGSDIAVIEQAINKFERPIEDSAVVCIDGRPSEQSHEPVREKVAGGNLNTFLYSAAAVSWRVFSEDAIGAAGPSKMLEEAADFLVTTDEKLGGHIHTPHHGSGTGCGAVDKAHEISLSCSQSSDLWIAAAKEILTKSFDENAWNTAKEGYARLAADPKWENWDTRKIQKVVAAHGGVIEELENSPSATNHGHNEQAIHINFKEGYSNDRDQAKMQWFQVDAAPMLRMSREATADDKDFVNLLHAMIMRQLGTAYVLTNNQNVLITRQ